MSSLSTGWDSEDEDFFLGTDVDSGEEVFMSEEDRARGVYVIGRTGMGKTVLLENVIVQDLARGDGLCVLDPHRDMIDHVLARLPSGREGDVILLDVREKGWPFGLNPFACEDPWDAEQVARTADHAVQVFKKVWGVGEDRSWGPRLEDLLGNVAYTLIANPGMTMVEIPPLLTDHAFRADLLANVDNVTVADFWTYEYDPLRDPEQRELRASTLNKVRAFLRDPLLVNIVGQAETTLPFREILDEGRILLVKLDRRLETLTTLVGSMLVGRIADAAFSREAGERRPFALYADEYQRFATPDFAVLLTEARKYGVRTMLAHQFRDQLDRENRGATLNASTVVVFRVTPPDAEELAGLFAATPPAPQLTERVIGQRAKLTLHPDPVRALLTRGHKLPEVNRLVAEHLAPIKVAIDSTSPNHQVHTAFSIPSLPYTDDYLHSDSMRYTNDYLGSFTGWTIKTPVQRLQRGLSAINRYFVALMEGSVAPFSSQEGAHLHTITMELAQWMGSEFVGFADGQPVVSFEATWEALQHFFAGHSTHGLDLQAAKAIIVPAETEWWHKFAEEGFAHVRAMNRRERHVPSYASLEKEYQDEQGEPHFHDMLAAIRHKEQEAAQRREPKLQAREAELAHLEQHMPKWAESLAEIEVERLCTGLLPGIVALGHLLAESPIHTETGQYEEIYAYEQERTYGDVGNQIANELATLPAFTARCKVGSAESTIQPEWEEPSPPASWLLDSIQEHNRGEGICRDRAVVEAEIRRRRQRDDEGGMAQASASPPPWEPPDPTIQGREPV